MISFFPASCTQKARLHTLMEKEVAVMLAACGSGGLMFFEGSWRPLPCPLPCPEILALSNARLAVVDNTAHTAWDGRHSMPVDSGVEAMLLWGDSLLTLSGDTDCLTLFSLSTALPHLTVPAGVYPQDMCLLPGGRSLAVCGGADGMLRVFRLPGLWEAEALRLPGNVQRVACLGGALYALCAMEQDGLCCQLFRLHGRSCCAMARWPGLPGAIHADGLGRLWVAASETLCCLHHGVCRAIAGDFGLIRRMDSRGGVLLAADPVMDTLWRISGHSAAALWEGPVQHGIFAAKEALRNRSASCE